MCLKTLKSALLLCTLAISSHSISSPLSEYNLILSGDYVYHGGEVEGASFIGGELVAYGHSPTFGTRDIPIANSLSVVGDINAANLNINRGNLTYGSALNVGNVNMNSGGSVSHDNDLSIDGLVADLLTQSSYLAGLTSNGVFNAGYLTYTGSDELAIFEVNFDQVFAQNTTLKLAYGNASTVVINVHGENVNVAGGVNITDGFRNLGANNIIWNFADASSINFNSICMYGAVLAINAELSGGCVFDGGVAAKSYEGSAEFHQFLTSTPPPTSNIEVSSPTMSILILSLFAGILIRRRFA
ncbi:choice-of-anchor A family protein [Glaciecola sp. 1036]|uniref:choice-of-anchor A family protein n=1 Tax=Alteromonadaceae TaxID=72275 RepID=UPI003CFC56AC